MMNAPIKVLLIEDNPADARLIQIMLAEARALSYDFSWVDSLTVGIERLRTGHVDVVLLTSVCPKVTGSTPCTGCATASACPPWWY